MKDELRMCIYVHTCMYSMYMYICTYILYGVTEYHTGAEAPPIFRAALNSIFFTIIVANGNLVYL